MRKINPGRRMGAGIPYRCLCTLSGVMLLLLFPILVASQEYETMPDTTVSILVDPADDVGPEEDETEGVATDEENVFTPRLQEQVIRADLRSLPDSMKRAWKGDPEFWYADIAVDKEKDRDARATVPVTRRSWFQSLLWVIVLAGFTVFIGFYLASSNMQLFRKSNPSISRQEEELDISDIFSIRYTLEIEKALQQGDYRLAIRLMYLRMLKTLAEKRIIQYQSDRTNFDYLAQLSATRYYEPFFKITRDYEYSWYGQFDVNESAYQRVKKDFERFETTIP